MILTGAELDDIAEALKRLDEAEAYMRLVDLHTTPITVHFINVARIHCRASINDVKRETSGQREAR